MKKGKKLRKLKNSSNTRLDSAENENTVSASSLLLETAHTNPISMDSEYKMYAFN